MRSLPKCLLILPLVVLLNGCIFPELIEVFVSSDNEGVFISLSFASEVGACATDPGTDNEFTCLYSGDGGAGIKSGVVITGADLLFLLLLDPVVVQLPADASDFAGSFLHSGGTGGSLAIASGLTSFKADYDTTLQAEPGTQFVIIAFPDGAPTTGDFSFNFNYRRPPGSGAHQVKVMFTGRVDTAMETFYPPLAPCETSFLSVPSIDIPGPPGGPVTIPVASASGCDGEVYIYGAAPVLGGGRLTILALLLAVGSIYLLRRRTRAL